MLGGYQGPGGQALVVAALEEAQEALADLVGGHAAESRLPRVRVTSTPRRLREPLDAGPRGQHRAARTGRPGLYGWIEKPPSALIVPLDGDGVVADRAVPPSGRRALLGVPAGRVRGRRRSTPRTLAREELAEETGLRAGRLEHLGRLYFAYGLSNQPFDVWRATELAPGRDGPRAHRAGLVARRFAARRGRADGPRERDPRRGVGGRVAPALPAALSRASVCVGWSITCRQVTRSTLPALAASSAAWRATSSSRASLWSCHAAPSASRISRCSGQRKSGHACAVAPVDRAA